MARAVSPHNGRRAAMHRTEVGTAPRSMSAEPPGRVLIEPRTIWLAAAVFGGLILSWVVISRTVEILLLLFLAIIFAEGIRPVVDRLSSRFLPRPVAVLFIYLVLLAVAAFVVTMSILMGGSLFGIMGAVVAVPLAVVLKVLLVRVLAPAFRRSLATTPRSVVQLPGSAVAQEELRLR